MVGFVTDQEPFLHVSAPPLLYLFLVLLIISLSTYTIRTAIIYHFILGDHLLYSALIAHVSYSHFSLISFPKIHITMSFSTSYFSSFSHCTLTSVSYCIKTPCLTRAFIFALLSFISFPSMFCPLSNISLLVHYQRC